MSCGAQQRGTRGERRVESGVWWFPRAQTAVKATISKTKYRGSRVENGKWWFSVTVGDTKTTTRIGKRAKNEAKSAVGGFCENL